MLMTMKFCNKYCKVLLEGFNIYSKKCPKDFGSYLSVRRLQHSSSVLVEKSNNHTSTYGQPTPETHPHIMKPGELVPGFVHKEFAERRFKLIQSLHSTNPKSCHVVLIPSATIQYMTDKIPYIFRQNSDFRYLTGCLEPDSALLIFIASDGSSENTIFVREKTSHSELWEGPRTGVKAARGFFGVDKSKSIDSLASELTAIKKTIGSFTFWYDFSNPVNNLIHKSVVKFLSESGSKEVHSLKSKIHELRLLKSGPEQAVMKESAEIASRGIENAMSITRPGVTEHQLFATVDYYCRMNKAEHLAYPPVVATGNNANTIHYIENTQQVLDGEMILMDAGCELHGYCSDITRTWPANGKFSEPQRTLYEVVLDAQLDLIEHCKQNPMTLNKLFNKMCVLLAQNLKEAHVLTKEAEKMQLDELGYKLCPHHVGHYLGMDVHDTGNMSRDIPLCQGMVITIEPGLYVKVGSELTKPEFHGMGIRIEDDVLITNGGVEVMSNAVKCPDDVELLCQSLKS